MMVQEAVQEHFDTLHGVQIPHGSEGGGMDHSVFITMHDSDQGPGLSGQSSMGDPGRQGGPAAIAVPPVPPSSSPPQT
jgi:hypothetical protein